MFAKVSKINVSAKAFGLFPTNKLGDGTINSGTVLSDSLCFRRIFELLLAILSGFWQRFCLKGQHFWRH